MSSISKDDNINNGENNRSEEMKSSS